MLVATGQDTLKKLAENTRKLCSLAIREFGESDSSYMAAGIAYWALFSLFPLSLAVVSILGFLYPSEDSQQEVVAAISRTLPVSGDYLASLVAEVAEARGILGLLAGVIMLLSGAKLFAAIRRGINHAWKSSVSHGFFRAWAIDSAMLFGAGGLAIVIVVFGLSGLGLPILFHDSSGFAGVLVVVLREFLAVTFTFGIFLVLYRYLPNTEVHWRDVWFGALVGGTLFYVVKLGFTLYLTNFDSFNLVFGSLGTLMAALTWAYFSSQSLLWGAHFASAYSQLFSTQAQARNQQD